MSWFDRLSFRKKERARERRVSMPTELPGNLLLAMREQDFGRFSAQLREWCVANKGKDGDCRELCEVARSSGWDEHSIQKIQIFFNFYLGKLVEAFEQVRPFFEDESFDPDLFVLGLSILYENNQFEEAYRLLIKGKEHLPVLDRRSDYWQMHAVICWSVNAMAELRQATRRMCELAPDDQAILETACAMFLELGDMDSFESTRKSFLSRFSPGLTFGLVTLASGDYEAGFHYMEARYSVEQISRYVNDALLGKPRWQGDSLAGKTLFISVEQGLGDAVQMARYFPGLLQLGPRELIVEAQPQILSLFEYNFPEARFVERQIGKLPSADYDFWVASMSLPHFMGTTVNNVPLKGGYLRVPPDVSAYWQQRVSDLAPKEKLRIGLAWSGQPAHRADRRRSIPYSSMMEKIECVEACFFALQTSVPAIHPDNLMDISEEMVTLADTAALIDEMDLVITVDTSVVHLAGALGKKTWLLLPYRYEWRWGLEGEGNAWYDSVQVLRQEHHGDWGNLLKKVFEQRLLEFTSMNRRR